MGKKTTEGSHSLESWQIEDAERLRELFDRAQAAAKARGERFTQETFGEQSSLSTAMVWQYMKAHRPLNIIAAAKFAKALNVSVSEFSPTLAAQIDQVADVKRPNAQLAPVKAPERLLQWIDHDEAALLHNYRATDDTGRSEIMGISQLVRRVLFDELANHKAKSGGN